jgi:aspartyl protease family protein
MNAEDGPSLIWGVVMIMLLVASLAARRMAAGQLAKMALAWIAIFAAMFVVFSFRFELLSVWDRVKSEFSGTAGQSYIGEAIAVKRQDDGHYWVRTQVNGKDVDFMIDSGATTTAVGSKTASEIGLAVDSGGYPIFIDTANGRVKAYRGVAQTLQLGPLKLTDHKVVVSENFGDTNVLGMNFLESMKSWKVENNVMTLQP